MIPFTSAHVRRRAAPVMGLVPTFPSIVVLKTSVIPVFDRTVKLLADPRFTGVSGAAAAALEVPAASKERIAMGTTDRVLSLKILLMVFQQGEDNRDCSEAGRRQTCLLYTSPSPRDGVLSRMPSSA